MGPRGRRVQGGDREAVQTAFFEVAPPADDKAGHRSRLRRRFRDGGDDAVPDYELLEMVLFRALPRGDTKPLAKTLLARFGTFAETINAPEERLLEIEGVGERVIDELKLVRAAALNSCAVRSWAGRCWAPGRR